MDKKKILLIDDVKMFHESAYTVLKDDYEILHAMSAAEGFDILEKTIPDLILLDIIMPNMDGYGMLKLLKKNHVYKNIPVIFLTADTSPESEVEGFDLGIVDYITKPFVPTVMKKRIEMHIALAEYERSLEAKVQEKVKELETMYDVITVSFAGLVESRDGVTGGHLKNTSLYFNEFLTHLLDVEKYKPLISYKMANKAKRSAPLHDVGKIAIEDAVLRKASSLSNSEFDRMKQHSVIGGDLFKYIGDRIPDKEFAMVAEEISRYHHEKWNGSGYPEGLAGEDIPLMARIMSIVDVYDALTSKRPYKEPFSHEKSMAMIVEKSGIDFDPDLVSEFVNIGSRIKVCLEKKESGSVNKRFFSVVQGPI